MRARVALRCAVAGAIALAATAAGFAQDPAVAQGQAPASSPPAAAQGKLARGLEVTFASLDEGRRREEGVHSVRARLLALDVERGETPSPLLSPGMFSARFQGLLTMAARERARFRIAGRGSVRLEINGKPVLEGVLRAGKLLETAESVRLDKGDNQVACTVESTALGEAQLRVSWTTEMFAWEPLPPEVWQWPADDADLIAGERLRTGQQLFADRRCARCHELERQLGETAFGELDNPGPDLRLAGARLQAPWIAAWLTDPRAIRPDAHMPKMPLEARTIADIAAHLGSLGTHLEDPKFTAEETEAGAERFVQLGCNACHVPPNGDLAEAALGDRMHLGFAAAKWHPAALVQFLQEPGRDYPHTRMPDFRLVPEDARRLAAFLLAGTRAPLPAVTGDAEAGRKAMQQQDCGKCHAIDAPPSDREHAQVRNLKPDQGCLAAAKAAPDHGLSPEQVAALRAFLPVAEAAFLRRSPLDFAARQVTASRCLSCHARDGESSVWAQVLDQSSEPRLPDRDPVAQGLPALTWVGAKLQPSWLEAFVTGKGSSPRPWLHARMPVFSRHGAGIVAGLVREQGYGPQDEPPEPPDATLVPAGQKLVKMGEGFNCVQCHGVGATPPVQVFERQGVNFAVAAQRLRKEYFLRWMMDPPRIDPDSRMPRFADAKGRTAFTDVLGGDAARQFQAIWHWFRTLPP